MIEIGLGHYLTLAAIIFTIGIIGIFLNRKNVIIILIDMIGAITLTFSKRENVKRQKYFDQIQREKSSGVSLVDVESGKGVTFDE